MGSSRKASATSSRALAAIQKSVMSLFIQQLGETLALGLGKGVRCRRLLDAAATCEDHGQHTKAQHQQARRAVPEQQGLRIHRRVVTNEVAITVHRVIDDLVVALPSSSMRKISGADPSRWARWNRRCSDSGTSDNAALRSTSGSARVRPHRETRRCRSLPGPWKPGTAPAAQRGSIVSFVHQLLIERCELLAPDTIIDHADELVTDDALLVDGEGLGRAIYASPGPGCRARHECSAGRDREIPSAISAPLRCHPCS